MDYIQENLNQIHNRIENACKEYNREANTVSLLLATKTVEPDKIKEAIQCGETIIGENKVQEAVSKYPYLQELKIQRHFIGHLQSNKVKQIINIVTMVQSVDRLSLAKELSKHLKNNNQSMDILVQINSSYEDTKSGVLPENTVSFIKEIYTIPELNIKGLMTIGANSEDVSLIKKSFQIVKELSVEISKLGLENVSMDILSMGMSTDLEYAIEMGSTMVRIGSAVFGERN